MLTKPALKTKTFRARLDFRKRKKGEKRKHCLLAVRLSISPDTFWMLSPRNKQAAGVTAAAHSRASISEKEKL